MIFLAQVTTTDQLHTPQLFCWTAIMHGLFCIKALVSHMVSHQQLPWFLRQFFLQHDSDEQEKRVITFHSDWNLCSWHFYAFTHNFKSFCSSAWHMLICAHWKWSQPTFLSCLLCHTLKFLWILNTIMFIDSLDFISWWLICHAKVKNFKFLIFPAKRTPVCIGSIVHYDTTS